MKTQNIYYILILQLLLLSCNSNYDYSYIYDYQGYKNGDIELVKFDDYITLGDEVEKVNTILGIPNSKNKIASIQTERWKYDEGTIIIKENEVYGWMTNRKLPIELPIKLQLKSTTTIERTLSLESDFWNAIALYGAPSSIDLSFITFGRVNIEYGYDNLTYKNGKLISYDNRYKRFDIHFDIIDKGNKTFSIGSTQEEVMSCQDVPTSINVYDSYTQWKYDRSRIYFDNNGIVTSWDNHSKNLNLIGGDQNADLVDEQNPKKIKKENWFENSFPMIIIDDDENSVNLGDRKSDVIKLLKEPIAKNASNGGKETWKYKDGTIYIKNDAVIGWDNRKGLLIVRHLSYNIESDVIKLKLGASFEDVLNRCGTPSKVNLLAHTSRLTFGNESMRFRNNKLVGYDNAKGKFEFEFEIKPNSVCNGDLKIDIGTLSDDIYACLGMPISIIDSRHSARWIYTDYRFIIKEGKVSSYSKR